MMNFIIIGEVVARLSDEFINQNPQIDWFKIKGFRNIVAMIILEWMRKKYGRSLKTISHN